MTGPKGTLLCIPTECSGRIKNREGGCRCKKRWSPKHRGTRLWAPQSYFFPLASSLYLLPVQVPRSLLDPAVRCNYSHKEKVTPRRTTLDSALVRSSDRLACRGRFGGHTRAVASPRSKDEARLSESGNAVNKRCCGPPVLGSLDVLEEGQTQKNGRTIDVPWEPQVPESSPV